MPNKTKNFIQNPTNRTIKISQNKMAFSLLELSIVILIIAILMFGLFKGGDLIKKSKIAAASSITRSSIVSKIDNLVVWFETTMPTSFNKNETVNGKNITTWNNINPYQNQTTPNNATRNTTNNQPIYIENGINGLPVLRFDDNNDYLNYDGTALANSNYTVFVVEQRRNNKDNNYFIGGMQASSSRNLILGYRTNTLITHTQYANDYDIDITAYSSPIPRIHSFRFSSSIGKDYSLNGVIKINYNNNVGLLSYDGAIIGAGLTIYPDFYFNGDIGEIIIFSKYLDDVEKTNVEEYLKKKWDIKSD